mmetsp:Transcript_28568/g.80540  ORF Transcript_28568/g.80540 Transcript_28568/m.80540 type:complete len:246 (+) Transcript_28568:1440-2177(+)
MAKSGSCSTPQLRTMALRGDIAVKTTTGLMTHQLRDVATPPPTPIAIQNVTHPVATKTAMTGTGTATTRPVETVVPMTTVSATVSATVTERGNGSVTGSATGLTTIEGGTGTGTVITAEGRTGSGTMTTVALTVTARLTGSAKALLPISSATTRNRQRETGMIVAAMQRSPPPSEAVTLRTIHLAGAATLCGVPAGATSTTGIPERTSRERRQAKQLSRQTNLERLWQSMHVTPAECQRFATSSV